MTETEKEVWQTIQTINRAWTVDGDAEPLKKHFHQNMVAVTPTDQKRVEGGDNCVAGWMAFAENAAIHSWKELDPKITLYGEGQFAIATYYFELSFDMNGQSMEMKGRDMFSLVNEAGRWMVAANQFSMFPYQS